jgi:hypothetical protein
LLRRRITRLPSISVCGLRLFGIIGGTLIFFLSLSRPSGSTYQHHSYRRQQRHAGKQRNTARNRSGHKTSLYSTGHASSSVYALAIFRH